MYEELHTPPDERLSELAMRFPAGTLAGDLVAATLYVASAEGDDGYRQQIGDTIADQGLVEAWWHMQNDGIVMRSRFEKPLALPGYETHCSERPRYEVSDQILDAAIQIHAGKWRDDSRSAGAGITRMVRRYPAGTIGPEDSRVTPEFVPPKGLEAFGEHPDIMAKLQDVDTAETLLACEYRQIYVDNTAMFQLFPDCDIPFIQAVCEGMLAGSLEKARIALRKARDVIVTANVPEFPDTEVAEITLTDETIPHIATVLALSNVHAGLAQIPNMFTKKSLDVAGTIASCYFPYLFNEDKNPGSLIDLPGLELVRLRGGKLRCRRGDDNSIGGTQFSFSYERPDYNGTLVEEAIPVINLSDEHDPVMILRLLQEFCAPLIDYGYYVEAQSQRQGEAFFGRLGFLFENDRDKLPILYESSRKYLRGEYESKFVQPLAEGILSWSREALRPPDPGIVLREAAGKGTAHAIVASQDSQERVAYYKTRTWELKNPLAARTQLQLLGIDAQEFAHMLSEAMFELLRYGAGRDLADHIRRSLCNIVENVFDNAAIGLDDIFDDTDLKVLERMAQRQEARG
jgi:hypothetical protein